MWRLMVVVGGVDRFSLLICECLALDPTEAKILVDFLESTGMNMCRLLSISCCVIAGCTALPACPLKDFNIESKCGDFKPSVLKCDHDNLVIEECVMNCVFCVVDLTIGETNPFTKN
jgi:hypothetical protein